MKTQPKLFRPMLSATCEDIESLKYPLLASPKLDGIRCLVRDGKLVSRNLKHIPNLAVQKAFSGLPDGLDGELICGDPTAHDVWNQTQSAVMSKMGDATGVTFHVFDKLGSSPFHVRLESASHVVKVFREFPLRLVVHTVIRDASQLAEFEESCVKAGYEGIMTRAPDGLYKMGRSTKRDQWLTKVKRWYDAEGEVVGFVERQHNGNEATKDALGRTKRSTAKAGKSGMGTLGALVLDVAGMKVEVGSGFSDAERDLIWANREGWLGKDITFKYQGTTVNGAFRFPIYKGVRRD